MLMAAAPGCFRIITSLRACLKTVASAILADVEPGFQPGEKSLALEKAQQNMGAHVMRAIPPGGKLPPSAAGLEARRYFS